MNDLASLYFTDPMSLTRADRDAIVEDLQKKRRLFNTAGAAAPGPTKTRAKSKVDPTLPTVNLDED